MKKKLLFLFALMALLTTLASPSLTAQEERLQSQPNEQRVYILAGETHEEAPFIPPPPRPVTEAPTANIVVNYTGPWTPEARAAFDYAVAIWENLLVSSVTIEVDAGWRTDWPSNVLGGAGPTDLYANFPNASQSNTWYPVAIANARAGADLNGGDAEIVAEFNQNFPAWYFGTNGNPSPSQYDFVSVVLHELGHGLGFVGSMRVIGGVGSWGWGSAYPFIYDRYTETGGGQALLSFPNNSTTLAAQLTSNNIYFDGPRANAANGGTRPRLYAPGGWQQGSSYSHLDEAVYAPGTSNALMTPIINNDEANHHPGPIALGIFEDSGWVLANQNTAPVISYLPTQLLLMGTTRNNAIDLWAFTNDAQTSDSGLTFAITNSPAASAGISLDSNRYIDIYPNSGWTGSTNVTVRVTDPQGLTDTETFAVVVMSEIINTYLPLMLR